MSCRGANVPRLLPDRTLFNEGLQPSALADKPQQLPYAAGEAAGAKLPLMMQMLQLQPGSGDCDGLIPAHNEPHVQAANAGRTNLTSVHQQPGWDLR